MIEMNPDMRPLVLVGGGGHCRSVIEVAESAGRQILGILDLPQYLGEEISGYAVIGSDDDIPNYVDKCEFVVTLGGTVNLSPRRRLHQLIEQAGGRLATLVASTAYVSKRAVLGAGTVVHHQCVVNANAQIGRGCIINTGAIIEHDSEIGDYSHISTGVKINGACRVGEMSFVGSGATMINDCHIGSGIAIGAGSVVASNLTEAGIYVGVPARKIK